MALNPNEAFLPRAITVRSTVANMRVRKGPLVAHYNLPLDRGEAFRFVADSILVDDGFTVIGTNGAGQAGRWLLVRQPHQGADLLDSAAQTVDVTGDFWRVLPAIPITQNIVLTLGTTNAGAGDRITITRLDVAAFTVTVDNGGTGGGTLATVPISSQAFGDFEFDGTDWLKKRSALMV